MRPKQSKYLFYALFAALVLFLCHCNPAKKVAQQQKDFEQLVNDYLVKHPQPVDTVTKFLPGRIDSVPITIPVLDPWLLQLFKDSTAKAISTKYAASLQDCNRQVNEAFETGYQKAKYECSQVKVPKQKPDTVERLVIRTGYENSLKEKITTLQEQLKQSEGRKNYLWYLILSVIINLLLATVILKRK